MDSSPTSEFTSQAADSAPPGTHRPVSAPARTLPPPEWLGFEGPRSAASVSLDRYDRGEPVARRSGTRAELQSLAARRLAASTSGDETGERAAASGLARALSARGTELDQAIKLARRALLLGEDPLLREELAGWFTNLGEPALAAATLRPLVTAPGEGVASLVLTRVGSLLARAGEARSARAALEQALQHNPDDPLCAELLGAIAAWAPEALSPPEACEFYLEACQRRERKGERAAAFENLLRAFEMAPEAPAAAERLATCLLDRGRVGAADEVRREHARHAGPAARAVHLQRLRAALRDGDLTRALGAALDARLDAEIDANSLAARSGSARPSDEAAAVVGFDELLERLGLHDLLAARLELAGELLSGRELGRLRADLGRLYAGPLGRPERALEVWIDALVADPGNGEARQALLRHAAATRDYTPLVEALVRVGEAPLGALPAEQLACLRELLVLAEESLPEPALALWAAERARQLAPGDEALASRIAELEPRARAAAELVETARAELQAVHGSERIERLSHLAARLQVFPSQADLHLSVLLELADWLPEDRSLALLAERLLTRQQRWEELETFQERLALRAAGAPERARAALALATARRRRGDAEGALNALAPLLDEAGAYPAALSRIVLLAAQQGKDVLRARALWRLSTTLSAPLRAVLCAVAGEALLRGGELESARLAVDQAVASDPSLARPAAARAAVGLVTRDRWGAEAMERAMGVVVPRAELCAALAEAYAALGDDLLALTFCQRQIALRPGDLGAARQRLELALRTGDGSRLADSLGWLLAQAAPLADLAPSIASCLRMLAPLEPSRGAALARGALDIIGPRVQELRLAVLAVADISGERGLAIAALERWLAAGAPSSDRPELLLDLARRRRAAGDADGSARALMRAAREGAWGTAVLAELDVALPARSSDGEIALLAARAEALSALSEADQRYTATVWRELGAAYWDLAADTSAAVEAWERAVALDLESGVENFATDALAFGGPDFTVQRLEELAARRSDLQAKARVLAAATSIALDSGKRAVALALAVRVLTLDSTRSDVLSLAERAAEDGELDVLESLYAKLSLAALGRFGERAVHYRAARQLERRRAPDRALEHAIQAFEAVPSEGVVFVTLVRLGERTGATAEVIRTIERVAARCKSPELRASWLRRAALLAGPSEEGLRQRVEVLLRALVLRADSDVLSSLALALRELLLVAPEEREGLELRMARALDSLLASLQGPEGGRFALAGARLLLEEFAAVPNALRALERAVSCDGSLEEYTRLLPSAALLAPAAGALVSSWVELTRTAYAGIGAPLLSLGAKLAELRQDPRSAAILLVHAAHHDPQNESLVDRAERAARELSDPALTALALQAIPVRDRGPALIDLAAAAARRGDRVQAIELLQGARRLDPLSPVDTLRSFEALLELFRQDEDDVRQEALLREELALETRDMGRRSQLARELSQLFGVRGQLERALALLDQAQRDAPLDLELLSDYVAFARQAGDTDRIIRGLSSLVDLAPDRPRELGYLRELAELLERSGDLPTAYQRWAQVQRLEPDDLAALAALEREAERRGDYENLLVLLARRASLAQAVDDVRRIRLRRASVLEQRLGRADEARAELEMLSAATGDSLSVLRVLADLNERLGAALRAAPLWLRASAVAQDREEASDLASRACEAYLLGGDVESARRVLDGMQVWSRSERILRLAVDIERRRESPLNLADALDELATHSREDPAQRAAWLVEAARAGLAVGAAEGALSRAQRAAELAPSSAEAQLLACSLSYRNFGPGSFDAAHDTAERLAALPELPPEQAELRAFLLAEARSASGATQAAMHCLEQARAELGLRPLLALGFAESWSRDGEHQRSLPCFDVALGGDLRGLRSRGRVACHAADVARRLGELERAANYLELAAEDPETRQEALALIAELFSERASLALRVAERVGASILALGASPTAPPMRPLGDNWDRTVSRRPTDPVRQERPLEPFGRYSQRPPASTAEERLSARVSRSPPTAPRAEDRPTPVSGHLASEPAPHAAHSRPARASGAPPGSYSFRPAAPRTEPPAAARVEALEFESEPEPRSSRPPRSQDFTSTHIPTLSSDEAALYQELSEGSLEAGKELIAQLEGRPERSHDLVAVCRRLICILPGNGWALTRLHEAALADRNSPYARALEHAMRALEPAAASIEPPLLTEQDEQPDAVRALLLRDYTSPALEALALVWEGAEHVFRRDPSTYGLTGLERVPPGSPSPVARAYAAAARALGVPKTPLFQRRSAGPPIFSLALLSPPAVVLSGDVRAETPELRYQLGVYLGAAMPQFALLIGSSESQARGILEGLAFAFGPPRAHAAGPGGVPNLAEVLWESIPARLQRRLRELCNDPAELDYASVLLAAKAATRRAGLFVSGDLGLALGQLCLEEGLPAATLGSRAAIDELCSEHPVARALVQLATSAEYAQTRWHLSRPGR